MPRWAPVPIVGGSYADDTRPFSHQETVNWLPMRAERPGGRSNERLKDVPGLRPFSIVGSGPIRGAHNVEGKYFVVSGTKLYQLSTTGTATEIGTVPGSGLVSMAHNQVGLDGGQELVIGTTTSGYLYNTKLGTFSQITDPGFPGAQSVDFIGGYIIGIEPQRRYWFHSEVADAREYNTTDIYAAESAPDKLVGLLVVNNEVIAAGERTTEFFINSPTDSAAFQRAPGVSNDKGCASAHTLKKLDNSAFMLGCDGIVYRLDGYRWVRVSTHPIEQAISRLDISRAFAFTYEDRGHAIYYLTFPDGQTWGYDVSQGEWARRESYGFDRWRINTLTRWNDGWYAGDFARGRVYRVDWDYHKEDQERIVRKRRTAVLHDSENRVAVHAVKIVVDTGQPESVDIVPSSVPVYPALSISGDLGDGFQGEAVSYQYALAGGVEPRVADISVGALPAGTTMNANGLVTGTRTTAGGFSWTARVTGAEGRVATVADTSQTSSAEIYNWATPTGAAAQVAISSYISGNVIAIGHQNNNISYSTDGGITFTSAAGVHPSTMDLYGVIKYAGDWYAFGQWAGAARAAKATGDTFSFTSLSIAFNPGRASGTNCWVINGELYVAEHRGSTGNFKLHKTTDPAGTWTAIDTGIPGLSANQHICTYAKSGSYHLFGTTDGRVLRSSDLVTFAVVLTASSAAINSLAAIGATVLAGGDTGSVIYRSTDNGATFAAGYSGSGMHVLASSYHFISVFSGTVRTSLTGENGTWTQRLNTALGSGRAGHGFATQNRAVFGTSSTYVYVGST